MKTISFFFALLLIPLLGFAQVVTEFTGNVIEENSSNPVANAIITVEGTVFATKTNDQGEFTFNEDIPSGEQIIIISKNGYETKYFIVNLVNGNTVIAKNIGLELTRAERKARKKEKKRLAKHGKKLRKKGNKGRMIIDYKPPIEESTSMDISRVPDALPIQGKYATILNVVPNNVENMDLYRFIDQWIGTPYKMGGANHDGIDCSSFTQMLYSKIFDLYIERTAETQFTSKYTDRFEGREFLQEGDLLFFKKVDDYSENITHVGIYLQNNMFVHATSNRDKNGNRGVQISDIGESYWIKRFVAAGRRIVK